MLVEIEIKEENVKHSELCSRLHYQVEVVEVDLNHYVPIWFLDSKFLVPAGNLFAMRGCQQKCFGVVF